MWKVLFIQKDSVLVVSWLNALEYDSLQTSESFCKLFLNVEWNRLVTSYLPEHLSQYSCPVI